LVTPNRNRRSREFEILGHLKSECPVTIDRNTHIAPSRIIARRIFHLSLIFPDIQSSPRAVTGTACVTKTVW
jgi:hypothetical protein